MGKEENPLPSRKEAALGLYLQNAILKMYIIGGIGEAVQSIWPNAVPRGAGELVALRRSQFGR